MAAQAIDNSGLINYRGCLPAGFTPNLSYSVSGSNVTVVDSSVIPSADSLSVCQVRLHDKFGGEVRGSIAYGGVGYTSVPTISFTGGAGSGAAATAIVANGRVTGFTITSAGTGYTSAPTVVITGGGYTTIATAAATVASGALTAITLTTKSVVLSSSTLNTSRPLDITATVLTDNHIAADGSARNIGTSGSLATWDIQQNA